MIYPSFICLAAYNKALEDSIAVLEKIAMPIDVNDRKCLGSICIFRIGFRIFLLIRFPFSPLLEELVRLTEWIINL